MSMTPSVRGLTALAMTLTLSLAAQAAWQPTRGPVGGYVNYIASNGNVLIAASEMAGLFRSADDGLTWSHVGGVPGGEQVNAAANSTQGWFVTTEYRGVYRSVDGGLTWQPAEAGLSLVRPMAIHSDGAHVYLVNYEASERTLYRWSAVTESWEVVATPVAPDSVYVEGDLVLCGTNYSGVLRSTNGGTDWTYDTQGDAIFVSGKFVRVGGAIVSSGSFGCVRTLDDGQSWDEIAPPSGPLATNGAVLWQMDAFTGARESHDVGTTWTPINTGLPGGSQNLVWHNGWLFTGVDTIYRRSAAGGDWARDDAGLIAARLSNITAAGNTVYATTYYGSATLHRSDNGGLTWTALTPLPGNVGPNSIFAWDANTVFVGTNGNGIFRSDNRGQSWVAVNTGVPQHKNSANTLQYQRINRFTRLGNTLFASTGGGLQAIPLEIGPGPGWPSVPSGAGVLRSDNLGQSWTRLSAGLPVVDIDVLGQEINPPMFVLTAVGSTLMASTRDYGVYRSIDGGNTWQAGNIGVPTTSLGGLTQMADFVASGNDILTVSRLASPTSVHDLVFRSADGGLSWIPSGAGLPQTQHATALVRDGGRLVVSCYPYTGEAPGLYESYDEGATWAPAEENLTVIGLNGLVVADAGLIGASDGLGAWRELAVRPGDMNCDGAITFKDINPFVLALGGDTNYTDAFPACNRMNADTNHDGAVTFADIDAFVGLLGTE